MVLLIISHTWFTIVLETLWSKSEIQEFLLPVNSVCLLMPNKTDFLAIIVVITSFICLGTCTSSSEPCFFLQGSYIQL